MGYDCAEASVGQEEAEDTNVEAEVPSMHVGFKEAYFHIRKEALRSVISAMFLLRTANREQTPNNAGTAKSTSPYRSYGKTPLELCFCGHSLGGVLATLLAYDVSVNLDAILQALDAKCVDEAEVQSGVEMPKEKKTKRHPSGPQSTSAATPLVHHALETRHSASVCPAK